MCRLIKWYNIKAVSEQETAFLVLVMAEVVITSCQLDRSWDHLFHI